MTIDLRKKKVVIEAWYYNVIKLKNNKTNS